MGIHADIRLAIPVLASWLALAIVITASADNPEIAVTWGWGICVGSAVLALVSVRKLPVLSLSAAMVACAMAELAFRAPTHVEIKPWDREPVRYSGALEWANSVRDAVTAYAQELPGFGGELVPGLAIGDTSQISEVLNQAMKTASLTHLTAVSGANCAIVIGIVMTVTARLRLPRWARVVAAGGALFAFVIVVTPQSSVVRAAVMAVVVLVSLVLGRPGSGVPILATAALGMLLWDPWWAVDFGFILSVLATGGLLVLARPIALSLSRWMPETLAMLVAIPLAAQLACQPVIILLSPALSTYGVVANVLAGFAAPIATISGLIAALLLPIIPWLGHVAMWVTWIPASWIASCALVFSKLPLPQIPWPEGLAGLGLAVVFSTLLCVMLLARRAIIRRTVALGLTGVLFVFGGTQVITRVVAQMNMPHNWIMAVCDVGQGDAVLVRSLARVALIDTGREPERLSQCLSTLGINHIDLLVLTHYDMDHIGGVSAVLGKVDMAVVGKTENLLDQGTLDEIAAGGTKIVRGVAGQSGLLGQLTWSMVWPEANNPEMQTGNPGSLTLLIRGENFSGLFLGDLDERAQNELLRQTPLPAVDVVKVAHHGSSDQSARFYQAISPAIAALSVGKDNGYGHPTKKTLDMLAGLGTLTPRTDQQGLLLVIPGTSGLAVWSER